MYIGFDLKLESFFTEEQSRFYYAKGYALFKNYSSKIEEHLNELILSNGNIDGGQMQSNWFPEIDADIFISHSHQNAKDVIVFAGYLHDVFGLISFIDSCIWGYSADLLKKLDNNFCKTKDGYYDYEKRNFTTSNVHMMLSTALTKMMDRTECLFFFNTPESISISEGVKNSTLSPWIYAEIETSKIIRRKTPEEHRIHLTTRTFSKGLENLYESIQYPLDLMHLTKLGSNDLIRWKNNYKRPEHALDTLYRFKGEDSILK